jgi:transcriptional regulator with XRE-family HTH domain
MAIDRTIGRNLRRLRDAAGTTQEELADVALVHPDTIRKLEQGQQESARIATLKRLAKALDTELADLFATPAPPEIADLAERVHQAAAVDTGGDKVTAAARRPDGSTTGYLAGLTQELRVLDDTAPTGTLLTVSQPFVTMAQGLVDSSPERYRRDIGRAAAQAALANWWFVTDAEQDATAAHAAVLSLAVEWDAQQIVGHLFGWRAGVALRDGRLREAVHLAQRARDPRWGMSAGQIGWSAGYEARAQALLGDQDGLSQALDTAEDAYRRFDAASEPPWMYWLASTLEPDLLDLAMLRDGPDAAPALEAHLATYPEERARDVAWYRAHIATANALAGDIEGAVVDAERAARLSAATGSTWTVGELAQLAQRPHLAPLRTVLADYRTPTPAS